MPSHQPSWGNDVFQGLSTAERPRFVFTGQESMPAGRCLDVFRIMCRTRVLELQLIKQARSGQGYYWIGGPGEEAFNTCLGLQVKKGQGPAFDYLHLHYRNTATMTALGMPLVENVRQMTLTARDRHARGRNFINHWSRPEWNVITVVSPVGMQYLKAPGTAHVQKRHGGDGVTIVTGGEAGTSQGDFASCLVWSSRPANELPVLMIVTNNGYGISTPIETQFGGERIADRGRAFGIPGEVVDGNDPVASWHAIARGMAYCRQERRPYLLEARVSRLYGHSSSSGALRVADQPDCLDVFEARLLATGVLDAGTRDQIFRDARAEVDAAFAEAENDPQPRPGDVERDTYAPSPVDEVYPDDYTGLPC